MKPTPKKIEIVPEMPYPVKDTPLDAHLEEAKDGELLTVEAGQSAGTGVVYVRTASITDVLPVLDAADWLR